MEHIKRIGDKEREYVLKVLNDQFRTSAGGKMVKRLEETFAQKFGVKYAIAHINGTATMHSALVAGGVGPGDEVIVPPLTMASTSFAVLHANAIPVFADVDPDTFTIDPSDVLRKITPNTKAIITVALYGLAPDMDAIMKIAEEYNIIVIEDDAECFLGYYKGKVVGSIGHMASFSFQSSKHLTSGDGGMVVTNDHDLAEKIRQFGDLGYAGLKAGERNITRDDLQDPKYSRHLTVGWNYGMPELCAAVALAQVERIEELVEQRMRVAKLYEEAIQGCHWLKPQKVPQDYVNAYWTYAAKLEGEDPGFTWYDFRRKYMELGGDGIYAAWKLTYHEPVFRKQLFFLKGCPVKCPHYSGNEIKYIAGLCPVAESIQPRLLQFKTNYYNLDVAKRKIDALLETIKYFNG